MNPALVFVLLIIVVAVAVTWWLMRALKRDRLRASADTRATNIEALRIERAELDRDRKLGLLTDAAHAEAVSELEARVLREAELDAAVQTVAPVKRSWWATASFALLLPLSAIAMYFVLGAPQAVIPELVRPDTAKEESQMDELFRVAEERLKAEPNDAKGWYLLARAKASVGRFDAAMRDYEKLMTLTPNDADAWADFADAAAGAAQGKMEGKPLELVNKALAVDPKQPKALLLRGTHQIQINDLDGAEKSFTLAKSVSDANSGFAQIADNALKDIAVRRAGAGPGQTTDKPPGAVAAQSNSATTNDATKTSAATTLALLNVTLSPEAANAASSATNAAVFIIVRAPGRERGPPLAAKKIAVASLATGAPISLTSSDSMIGQGGLERGAEVSIEARLSLTGQPAAQPGDFTSDSQRVTLSDTLKSSLTINKKL